MDKSKADFVASLFDRIPVDASNALVKKEIIGFLLNHTNKGKMYKYRKFNKYSIDNLQNNTLYCAPPSSFNDPFDCKIGVDYMSFFLYRYSAPMGELINCFEKFVKIYKGELKSEGCSEKELELFTSWKNAEELMEFIYSFSGSNISDDEVTDLLADNPIVIKQFLDGLKYLVTSETLLDALSKSMATALSHMDKETMKIAIDLNSSYRDFASGLGVTDDADEIEITNKIFKKYFPEKTMDAEKADNDLTDLLNGLANMIDEKFRVGCLCTDHKNRLMWSHYADSHKGFCIEYDFSIDCEELNEILILPVIYSTKRPKVPWEVALPANIDSPDIKLKGTRHMIQSLVTKDAAWSYEDEWRVIMAGDIKNSNIQMPPISCIYLGALCSEEDKNIVLKIAKEKNIPVKQMTIDRGEYSLHFKEIN